MEDTEASQGGSSSTASSPRSESSSGWDKSQVSETVNGLKKSSPEGRLATSAASATTSATTSASGPPKPEFKASKSFRKTRATLIFHETPTASETESWPYDITMRAMKLVTNLKIPKWSYQTDGGEKFIVYHVDVATESKQWTVKRRFSDFDNISSWIASVFPNYPLPELPSKLSTVFGSVEDVANKRRAPLQDWLQNIRMIDELALTYEFARFLGVYDNLLQSETINSSSSTGQIQGSPKAKKTPKVPLIRRDLINFEPKPALVYVRIEEATNFSPALPRDAKLFVEISNTASPLHHKFDAKSAYRQLGKTDSVSMKLDRASFSWYQDFALLQPDRRDSVRLMLACSSSKKGKSSKLVGHVHLDVCCMRPGQFYKVEASVVSSSNGWGRGAQLRALVCVEPMIPLSGLKAIGVSLPAFRFQLTQGDFYPGESINGILSLNITNVEKSFKATDLTIRLLGMEQTSFSPNAEDLVDVITKHSHEQSIIDVAKTFKAISDGHTPLKAGVYNWPFDFELPSSSLPPSFSGSKGSIKYILSAQFRCWTEETKVVEKEIPVLFDTDRFLSKKAMQPPKAWRDLQLSVGGSRNVRVGICMDRNYLVSGENSTVHLDIANNSPKSVTGASVSLMRCVRYSAGAHYRLDESRVQHLSFGSGPGFPVKSNDKGRISITLAVPSDLKPTLRSKSIEVTYMVNVAVKFPGSSEEYQVPERSKRVWLVRKDTVQHPSINQNLSQKELASILTNEFNVEALLSGGGLPLPPLDPTE